LEISSGNGQFTASSNRPLSAPLRSALFVLAKLNMLAASAADAALSEGELGVLADVIVAFFAHDAGPNGSSVPDSAALSMAPIIRQAAARN
jgi:hypothetical protein